MYTVHNRHLLNSTRLLSSVWCSPACGILRLLFLISTLSCNSGCSLGKTISFAVGFGLLIFLTGLSVPPVDILDFFLLTVGTTTIPLFRGTLVSLAVSSFGCSPVDTLSFTVCLPIVFACLILSTAACWAWLLTKVAKWLSFVTAGVLPVLLSVIFCSL